MLHVLSGLEAKQMMIPNTISQACSIGQIILDAQAQQRDPLEAVLDFTRGKLAGSGTIIDIDQKVNAGFLQGTVTIQQSNTCSFTLNYQNEYLFIKKISK